MTFFENGCRKGCAACCIAPSISSPMPKMQGGKPAGVACEHLTADFRCDLFGRKERPSVCASLRPTREMCGTSPTEAMRTLEQLEKMTAPASKQKADSHGDSQAEES